LKAILNEEAKRCAACSLIVNIQKRIFLDRWSDCPPKKHFQQFAFWTEYLVILKLRPHSKHCFCLFQAIVTITVRLQFSFLPDIVELV